MCFSLPFNSIPVPEERFRDYASKDFGSTLQQADND
jgi:hypothetical protein